MASAHAQWLGWIVAVVLSAAIAPCGSFSLNVIWTAQFNGKLYPNDKHGSMADDSMVNTTTGATSSSSWSVVYGGAGKVAGYIDSVRQTERNVVAIDLGNFYWGE